MSDRPIRVLIAKPGLDGHDVGAKLVCRALVDAGMEVIYTGLRRSPEQIVTAAVDEGVDAVGLSLLSGAHLPLTRKVADGLRASNSRAVLFVGGNIPSGDEPTLRELGVVSVFGTGTEFAAITQGVRAAVTAAEAL